MNGWLIFGLSLIALGAVVRTYSAGQESRDVMMVACTDGKTYREVEIMMFSEGKTVLFTKGGQTVIPGSVTCNGRVQH